jgi:radical SAM protein with 4Fe4S-binding SPASM domain
MKLMEPIQKFFSKEKPLGSGVYHRRVTDQDGNNYRLHLRVEEGGGGILSINAARILHLNPTATEHAKLILEGKSREEAVRAIRKRYRVGAKQAGADYDKLMNVVESLTKTDEVCPISYLDVSRIEPFSTPVSAPYRMDLALTYRCDNGCGHCYVSRDRKVAEMDTASWKKVIDRLWDIGIYHVSFTGGEATLRDDLAELVAYTQDIGMVSGLLTNGRRLADKKYLKTLVDEGIDYFQITLESADKKIHNKMVCTDGWDQTVAGIRNAGRTALYTITNTTITRDNIKTLSATVDFIATLGVNAFAMNSIIYSGEAKSGKDAVTEGQLEKALADVTEAATRNNLRFIWYTPTQYCKLDPMDLSIGIKQCTAGKFNMLIEPDGTVLPCQSYFEPVGNILTDDWGKIWNHPLLVSLRNRDYVMEKCNTCEKLDVCGGGCPLELQKDTYMCPDSLSNP